MFVYRVRALSCLLPGGNRRRQTVDSRERRRLILFVHVLGGKYLLYTAGSYKIFNSGFLKCQRLLSTFANAYWRLLLFFGRLTHLWRARDTVKWSPRCIFFIYDTLKLTNLHYIKTTFTLRYREWRMPPSPHWLRESSVLFLCFRSPSYGSRRPYVFVLSVRVCVAYESGQTQPACSLLLVSLIHTHKPTVSTWQTRLILLAACIIAHRVVVTHFSASDGTSVLSVI